jgi:hypothetical protein
MTVAGDILREAAAIVDGPRNLTHGNKERSFALIADLWTDYLGSRGLGAQEAISAADVALMMVLLKLARSLSGTPVRDHFADMAGYAAIAGELAGEGVPAA